MIRSVIGSIRTTALMFGTSVQIEPAPAEIQFGPANERRADRDHIDDSQRCLVDLGHGRRRLAIMVGDPDIAVADGDPDRAEAGGREGDRAGGAVGHRVDPVTVFPGTLVTQTASAPTASTEAG